MLILVRSVAFNVLFYLNTLIYLIIALPTFLLPYRAVIAVAKAWGRTNLVLLRVAGIECEIRGREKIPKGAVIVAPKHQSAWETFALLPLFDNPLFIVKRELQWIPIFGWLMIKGRMVPVDRSAGSQAIPAMTARARDRTCARGRQLIIFPEGTRRPAGAEPRYKFGVALLYAATGVPCVPIALNSGLFWPRRSIRRLPGTVLVEVLDPIAPGLDKEAFFKRLQDDIEAATARLIAEANEIAR